MRVAKESNFLYGHSKWHNLIVDVQDLKTGQYLKRASNRKDPTFYWISNFLLPTPIFMKNLSLPSPLFPKLFFGNLILSHKIKRKGEFRLWAHSVLKWNQTKQGSSKFMQFFVKVRFKIYKATNQLSGNSTTIINLRFEKS